MAQKRRMKKIISATQDMDKALGERLAQELLSVCVAALKRYGIATPRLLKICTRAIAKPDQIPTTSKLFRNADSLAELVNEWTDRASYLDSSGRPKVLPVKGPAPSFAGLVKRHFGRCSVDFALRMGMKTQVLELVGKNKVAQTGGCVIFAGDPNLVLVHAIQSIRSFLGTIIANAAPRKARSLKALPDRKATAVIPEKCVDQFIAVMRPAIVNTAEMANRWLTARELKRGNGRRAVRKVRVGVHSYVFRDRLR